MCLRHICSFYTLFIMRKLVFPSFVIVCFIMLVLQGCNPAQYKQVPYLQNSDSVDLSMAKGLYDARIMPKDLLAIYVSTPENTAASAIFNLTVKSANNAYGESSTSTSLETSKRYLVSNEGKINFPILGEIYVKGMTIPELQDYIAGRLTGTYLKVRPVVTVEMANFRVSVLGEVAHPGVFSVDKGKINIFEALALAGDMSIYGVRDKVQIVREDASGNKSIHFLDLTKADVINSPCYQLQQNDIVYVTPNKAKAKNSGFGQETSLWMSSISILISVASFLYNILK